MCGALMIILFAGKIFINANLAAKYRSVAVYLRHIIGLIATGEFLTFIV